LLFAGVLFINRHDLPQLGGVLRQVPVGLAISILVHMPQLVLTALAWRALLPPASRPPVGTMVGLRWIRESLNSLVPAGAILGQVVAAQRLSRTGTAVGLAGATATVDMTIEGGTQALITLAGLALLLADRGSPLTGWVAALDMALALAAIAAMVALQRNLPVRLVQSACARLAPRWSMSHPDWLAEFQNIIIRVHADWPTLLRAACYHLGAWTIGAVEIFGILRLLGHPIPLTSGFVVESLTQALRSAGFMVPGALGIQEGAIIAACGLVGAPSDAALALALLRRAREVLVGLLGLCALRWLRPRLVQPVPIAAAGVGPAAEDR
jgi:putative membrane protein